MKTAQTIIFGAALAASLTMTHQANAQYQARGEDGIYASPGVRKILNEQRRVQAAASDKQAQESYQARGKDGVAASPGVRRILDAQKLSSGSASETSGSVAYSARGQDGIYASPGVRKVLSERGTTFQIAPLK